VFPGHICQNSTQLAQAKQCVVSSALVCEYSAMSTTAEDMSCFFHASG
jgi:hypothetical protein